MVNWSIENGNLPDLIDKFQVHVLKFRNGKWLYQKFIPNKNLLQQSKQLLEKDVIQMNNLVEKMGPMKNLYLIPLSNNPHFCKKCSFKKSCPAKNGLEKAKNEQFLLEYNLVKERFLSN